MLPWFLNICTNTGLSPLCNFQMALQPKTFLLFNLKFPLHLILSSLTETFNLHCENKETIFLYILSQFTLLKESLNLLAIYLGTTASKFLQLSWLLGNFSSGDQDLWFWRTVLRLFPNEMFPEVSCWARHFCCRLATVAIAVTGLHQQQLHLGGAEVTRS